MFPETKGLSFEKLDELYAMKVFPRQFEKVMQETGNDHIVPQLNNPARHMVSEKAGVQVETV